MKGKFNCVHMDTVAQDGKRREMLSMPIKKLNGWLFSVNPNKIQDKNKRRAVELYQEECFEALHDYWRKGVAIKDDLAGIITGLDPEVMKMLGGMFKAIVSKQLREALPQMLPAMIAANTPFNIVRDRLSVGQILDQAKVPSKGRRSLIVRAHHSLKEKASQEGFVPQRDSLSRKWTFPCELADKWRLEEGAALIRDWQDEQSGQGVLQLVVSDKEDQEGDAK